MPKKKKPLALKHFGCPFYELHESKNPEFAQLSCLGKWPFFFYVGDLLKSAKGMSQVKIMLAIKQAAKRQAERN